jgi:hypothetical protein
MKEGAEAIARVTYAAREICLRSRTRPVPEDLSQTNGIPTTERERLTLTPNERVYILRLARLVRDHRWPCVQRFRSTYDYEECLEDGEGNPYDYGLPDLDTLGN